MSGKRSNDTVPSRYICGMCGGNCTVPVDPDDPRKGDRQCPNCEGNGTVGGT